MHNVSNLPISYDDHGNIPLDVPFKVISPESISIYLQLDTRVGKATCRQACSHCFFNNQQEARARSIALPEGRRIKEDLERAGFKVFPMVADSFANGGEFLAVFGNSHMREFRHSRSRIRTKTMERGQAWTSGATLAGDDYERLLVKAVDNGFGSIAITFHGILGPDLDIRPHGKYPIRGTFSGEKCVEIIRRINQFNAAMRKRVGERSDAVLDINISVTIGRHNFREEDLVRYVQFFSLQPISVLRFNCFHDHGWRHPELALGNGEVAGVYRSLKRIHERLPMPFELGVDEDFGTSGIEVMGFPEHTGWCRAGRQLFAVVIDDAHVIEATAQSKMEHVGSVAGCVDAFKPIVGRLLRHTDRAANAHFYSLEFFHNVIDELLRKRTDGTYLNGCFAGEMLQEYRADASRA